MDYNKFLKFIDTTQNMESWCVQLCINITNDHESIVVEFLNHADYSKIIYCRLHNIYEVMRFKTCFIQKIKL